MLEQFDLYKNVRSCNNNVDFQLSFKYGLSHQLYKFAKANGTFHCKVNPHLQTIEYFMDLKSETIKRPYNEWDTLLLSTIYEEIPPQTIQFEHYMIYRQRYKVPIDYDWHQFIVKAAEQAVNKNTMQALFRKWKLVGVNGQHVEANLKVLDVKLLR